MRILYGVCGDGFGHSSRAIVIGKFLQSKGHKIKIVAYGLAYKVLNNKFDTEKVKGLKLFFKNGNINYSRTFFDNLKAIHDNIKNISRFQKLIKEFQPELCISDMEPAVPLLAYWYKIPLISIDNQHRITNFKIGVPSKYYKDFFLARFFINRIVPSANYFIVTSFSELKKIKKNTYIVPPFIREDVRKAKSKRGNEILVYLTRKNARIINTLKKINEKFIIYGYNIKKKTENLEFREKESFLEDLRNCRAVISTAGFTLISEAIYLKKPYFALPLKGQFEQVLNALFIKKAGFGDYADELSKQDLESFLNNLKKYRERLEHHNSNPDKIYGILEKVLKKIKIKSNKK
ncbi:hypothetical protein HZA33_00915 [Candidatus Pacearchaeota archaeon]|nr:hypothetical protein [Candidatus Pacearchaeota archaeon]